MSEKNESIEQDYVLDDNEMMHRVEALLFAINRYLTVDEIAKICDLTIRNTRKAMKLLKSELEKRTTPVVLIESDNAYKLSVNQQYAHIVHKVVSQTELNKGMIETLAVIAWKNPIEQCEVVRLRHNKAYEHLAELDDKGFITRTPSGRTKIIKLTNKFFDYFDVPKSSANLKQLMPEEIAEKIENTEKELVERLDAIDELQEKERQEQQEHEKLKETQKENSSLEKF